MINPYEVTQRSVAEAERSCLDVIEFAGEVGPDDFERLMRVPIALPLLRVFALLALAPIFLIDDRWQQLVEWIKPRVK
jgi:hypothetical protein